MKKGRKTAGAVLLCLCLIFSDVAVTGAWEIPESFDVRFGAARREEAAAVQAKIPESKLYAKAAVLMDAASGRVLYEKSGDMVLPMASTTKIMTCILALENSDITKPVQISKRAAGMPDVQLNAKEGDYFYLSDLLYSLMLESHNDSAVAIAEGVAGSVEEFAALMNEKAQALGCTNTYYITPNGLDAKDERGIHSTTAKELARIMAYCVNESPQREAFLKITQTPAYTFHNVTVKEDGSSAYGGKTYSCTNHNAFLSMMEGAESGKTGFTNNAGYCYVGALKRGDSHLITALLACGWPPHKKRKWSDVRMLMQYGLDAYTYHPIETVTEEQLKSVRVQDAPEGLFQGNCTLMLRIAEGSDGKACDGLLLKEGERIETEVRMPDTVAAPVRKGEKIGQIRYLVDGEVYKVQTIEAAEAAERIDFAYCLHVICGKMVGKIQDVESSFFSKK
ncbi:MAG: D-alanyl-D-alanine carboxypeptidase [Lachnospiraceae bacterium]|nr:D-alanyl-D-alanine carboxypeptidase [Lachnospiraceae bacterium]